MRDSHARIVLLVFLIVQALDGLLTFAGIRQFGPQIEGNILVLTVIQAWGAVSGLAMAKAFACACGIILYLTMSHRLLAAMAGAHIGLAIVPWMFALAG